MTTTSSNSMVIDLAAHRDARCATGLVATLATATDVSTRATAAVDLDAYRKARRAVTFILGVVVRGDPPWLASVRAEVDPEGGARVVVRVLSDDPMIPRCLPSRVDDIPVVVENAR